MRIHEAAAAAGLTPRAVRFYEERGLLSAARRTENGYRDYGAADVERLRVIASLRELGRSVESIPELLAAWHDRERLLTLLDRERADAYAEWNELGVRVRAFDRLVTDLASAGADDERLHAAARKLRALRGAREWRDAWQFDLLADRFDAAPLPHLPDGFVPVGTYARTLDAVCQWVDPAAGEAGLDLGAGTGNLTLRLAASGARLSAVEQSAEMLRVLRRKCPGADARQGNLLTLPWPDGAFRFIAATFALELLTPEQQFVALAEAARVLVPDGRLAVAGVAEADSGPRMPDTDACRSEWEPAQAADAASTAPLYPLRLDQIAEWLDARGFSCVLTDLEPPVRLLVAVRDGQPQSFSSEDS